MKYRVIKGFQDIDGRKNPGDVIEVSGWREAKLRQARVIGGVVETHDAPQKAIAQPAETTSKPDTTEKATAKNNRERRG